MKRDPLSQALREAAIPVPAEAEERGLRVIEAAYAQRQPQQRQVALPRLALALAVATLLTALLLSPAGAAVRDWVDDVVTTSTPRPEEGLAEIPGGGRLLVQSTAGPWVVQPDGSRRLLGDYDEATWSPRGLFVAVAKGRTLSAVEPDGTPRWSLTAPARVGEPRWSPSGYRIAYRSGKALRVVVANGNGDRRIAAATATVAPSWSPSGHSQLAYVDSAGMLRIADSESGSPSLRRWRCRGSRTLTGEAGCPRSSKPRRGRCACGPSSRSSSPGGPGSAPRGACGCRRGRRWWQRRSPPTATLSLPSSPATLRPAVAAPSFSSNPTRAKGGGCSTFPATSARSSGLRMGGACSSPCPCPTSGCSSPLAGAGCAPCPRSRRRSLRAGWCRASPGSRAGAVAARDLAVAPRT